LPPPSPRRSRAASRSARGGQPLRRLHWTAAAAPGGPRCARLEGFSLHADVAVPAHRRDRLERGSCFRLAQEEADLHPRREVGLRTRAKTMREIRRVSAETRADLRVTR
jgi:hypothetical protein